MDDVCIAVWRTDGRDLEIFGAGGAVRITQDLPLRYFQVGRSHNLFELLPRLFLLNLLPDLFIAICAEMFQEADAPIRGDILSTLRFLQNAPVRVDQLLKCVYCCGNGQRREYQGKPAI